MEQIKCTFAAPLFAAAALVVLTTPLRAVTYLEPASDAGQTLATAQPTGGDNTTVLTAINGSLNNANDADLYYITIADAGTFSASTTSNLDPALFLFALDGTPIATNDDDASTGSPNANLAAGNSLYANLAAGQYLLAISGSRNEPINSAGQLLFADYPNGDTTATRGPASGLNPATLSDFDGQASDPTNFGAYQINLTSVNTAVPEPSTWAALATSAAVGGFLLRRRRQARA